MVLVGEEGCFSSCFRATGGSWPAELYSGKSTQTIYERLHYVHLLCSLHLKCSVAKLHDEINSKLACFLYALLASVLSTKLSVFVNPYCHIERAFSRTLYHLLLNCL